MNRRFFVTLCILFTQLLNGLEQAAAQELRDSLPEVQKFADAPGHFRKITYGLKELTTDSAVMAAYRNQSVASLLSQQFPVFVRTYGTNGLATLSLRGASAAQTNVCWDGVPLQNGATGLVDLMLLPVAIFDGALIQYGNDMEEIRQLVERCNSIIIGPISEKITSYLSAAVLEALAMFIPL